MKQSISKWMITTNTCHKRWRNCKCIRPGLYRSSPFGVANCEQQCKSLHKLFNRLAEWARRQQIARAERKKAGWGFNPESWCENSIAVYRSCHLWETRDFMIAKYSAHDAIIITLKMHNSILCMSMLMCCAGSYTTASLGEWEGPGCHVSHTAGDTERH